MNGAEEMENIENKNIFLVETILKETNISINIPQYIYGIEESKSFFISLIGNQSVEYFYAVYMNSAYETVALSQIAKGDNINVTLSISEVVRIALFSNAKYFLIAHNHPSGISNPSKNDLEITKKIAIAAKLFNIFLVDSIIVCKNGKTYSIREKVGSEID